MEIKIVVACFKKDLHLTRICVASVRHWYPDIEIFLLKDQKFGNFSTVEIERAFNCKVFKTKRDKFGWPWSKLEVIFHEKPGKWFFIDSDIVFVGYVLSKFEKINSNSFVVTGEIISDETNNEIEKNYLNIQLLRQQLDSSYEYPKFVFNGGQILISSGILKEEDFSDVISFEDEINNKYPKIFKHGDQGILNYKFSKFHFQKKIELHYQDFWAWPKTKLANSFKLEDIKNKKSSPYLIHWAGSKPVKFQMSAHFEILEYFESEYYNKVKGSWRKRVFRNLKMKLISRMKITKYKLLGMNYN
jgi:hypothetical protein